MTEILAPTLSNILVLLRFRLNDVDGGNYSDMELTAFIQQAYRVMVVRARCHKVKKSIGLVLGQSAYDCAEIFEPMEVSVGGKILNRRELGDMGVSLESWDSAQSGTPVDWLHLSGSTVRIYPAPDAAGTMIVEGLASPPEFSTSPDALPDGYAIGAILDSAEGEARRARATSPANAGLVAVLEQRCNEWVTQISGSVRSR